MSKRVLHLKKLPALQNLIEQEFAEFKDEITTGTGADVFNRAEEIIFKTHFTDEVLNGFPELTEYLGDEEDLILIIDTLYGLIADPSCDNVLNGIYEEYVISHDSFFDMDILSDFIAETYKDAL